jgi:hypothetical protein
VARLLGELRQVILRELARFERASGHRLGHAAGITFIDHVRARHGVQPPVELGNGGIRVQVPPLA